MEMQSSGAMAVLLYPAADQGCKGSRLVILQFDFGLRENRKRSELETGPDRVFETGSGADVDGARFLGEGLRQRGQDAVGQGCRLPGRQIAE